LKPFEYNFFSKRSLLNQKYENLIKEREDHIFYDKTLILIMKVKEYFLFSRKRLLLQD